MRSGPTRRTRGGIALLVAVLVGALVASGSPAAAVDTRPVSQVRTIVTNRANAAREARDLKTLKVHPRLQYWAQRHAEYMASQRTLVHDGPVRLRLEAPVTALAWSENIARNTGSNAGLTAHQMWMKSSGHRANILNRSSTHIGVGVATRGDYTYIVQRFATVP